MKSSNVRDDNRTVVLLANAVRLAVQVEEPLEAENAALRPQLTMLRRRVCGRVTNTNGDRLFSIQLYR
jgi:hypothetical protein